MNSVKIDMQAGTLDPEFNGDGVLHTTFPEISGYEPEAILALPDDKLLIAIRLLGEEAGYAVARLNKSGAIDSESGFGGQLGFVVVSFPSINIDYVYGLSGLSDDGSLLVGSYRVRGESSGLLIVRLKADGQRNKEFGQNGALFIDVLDIGKPEQVRRFKLGGEALSKVSSNTGMSAVEQPDGKIVLVSTGFDDSEQAKGVIMRLNPDGLFDKTFNDSGAAFIELEDIATENSAVSVAVQPGGKLVVCGTTYADDSSGSYVVRFDEGGKLDKNFGPVLINEETGKSLPWLKAITTRKEDGMIVAVGSANPGGFYNGLGLIVVLNPEGSFNRVFNGGKPLYSKLLATGEHWHGCAFGGDGDSKIIVTGSGGSSYVTEHSVSITARYLLTCEPDKTFNGQGWTVFHESERQESSLDMAIMADGRIVVSGFFWKKTGVSFPPYTIDGGWVLRYLV